MSEYREKAKELYEKFFHVVYSQDLDSEGVDDRTMDCCRICISEIISACEYNRVESYNTDWWKKVKEELEKL